MSGDESVQIDEKDFAVEIAKQGRASCKKCKEKCLKDEVRLAKLTANPFASGKMKNWYHVECIFEMFLKQRVTTVRIENNEDIDGFDSLPSEEQEKLINRIQKSNEDIEEKYGVKPSPKNNLTTKPKQYEIETSVIQFKHYPFKEFRKLVANVTNVNAYLDKTQLVRDLFKTETNGEGFHGDIHLWCKLLLPGVVKRIYNLQSKQLVKIFSKIFKTDQNKMLEHLEQGDVGETIQHFYETSSSVKPVKKSQLTVEDVDEFLEELSKLTKEEEQSAHFMSILKNCTSNDLKIIIRLIKHDLRMNAGAKHILDGVHPDAYEAYQSSRDLKVVIQKCLSKGKKEVAAKISVMTPVLPMLAEACKSVEMAMKKCPNGMYSEIKYDGERVQVHKKGHEFKYYSRSLKPVLPHKIAHFKEYIPKAFPDGNDLILDSEILMIDTETQAPLPFGSLGKHKKNEYENASVCLYIFDCLYYNGEDLTKKPIKFRKKILKENMVEVENHIVFSESKEIHDKTDLEEMMIKVFKLGLEGLVLKDLKSVYEPGKRHWLKVKRDYLCDGAMADTADLIVLGAWYGTGKKGGKMSVFLMGCYNEFRQKFCTVTKVHTGLDDKTLEELQHQLKMIKISSNSNKIPNWLLCNRQMVPDFVAENPENQPVWEITGAEFTQHDIHTADGISIRFPRITRMRHDKNWKTATTLDELKELFIKSKENTDFTHLIRNPNNESSGNTSREDNDSNSPSTSRKRKSEEYTETTPKKKQKLSEVTPKKENTSATPNTSSQRKSEDNSETNPKKKTKTPGNSPHNQYFKGVKLFLEEESKRGFDNYSKLFKLHGGIILNPRELSNATHILHLNRFVKNMNDSHPKSARHILLTWIEDTIKNESLCDVNLYTVKWRLDL